MPAQLSRNGPDVGRDRSGDFGSAFLDFIASPPSWSGWGFEPAWDAPRAPEARASAFPPRPGMCYDALVAEESLGKEPGQTSRLLFRYFYLFIRYDVEALDSIVVKVLEQ